MDYSSLAILSRCPQAPVPNLGQFDHQSLPSRSTPSSVSDECQHSPSCVPVSSDAQPVGDLLTTSADVNSQRSANPATYVHDVSTYAQQGSTTRGYVTGNLVAADDDEFDDFKTAPAASVSSDNTQSSSALDRIHDASAGKSTMNAVVLNFCRSFAYSFAECVLISLS